MRVRVGVWAATVGALVCLAPASSRADLVYFTSGQVLSVAGHAIGLHTVRLLLRGGGEVVCSRAIVARIAPDELPPVTPRPALPRPDDIGPGGGLGAIIEAAAARHGVPAALIRAVIQVESAFQPDARSRKGAMGLMQLMPATAHRYAVTDPFDPRENVEAGTRYLKSLVERFGTALGLAAYNAGEAAVRRFDGMPPFGETRAYVARVLRMLDATDRP